MGGARTLVTARLPTPYREQPPHELAVTLLTGSHRIPVGRSSAVDVFSDMGTLVRAGLANLASDGRAEVMRFLVDAASAHGGTSDEEGLSRSLWQLREALRERHPHCAASLDEPMALRVDSFVAVNRSSFYVRGWMHGDRPITALTAVSPEGARVALLDGLHRTNRRDLQVGDNETEQRLGFERLFTVDPPSDLGAEWLLEVENEGGETVEADAPPAVSDPIDARDTLVARLGWERELNADLMNHMTPAIEGVQRRLEDMVEVDVLAQFGSPPGTPETSVLVPLLDSVEPLEHQMAQFACDPEIFGADLVYVLGEAELSERLMESATQLANLYRLPFRVAVARPSAGLAATCNGGASLARGQRLVMLGPDVLPDQAGWLGKLTSFHASMPGIGALGTKLLFEDDSLQHAGVTFRRGLVSAGLEKEHRFTGLHRDFAGADVACPVPAVTGACLMIDAELYRGMGGLSSAYLGTEYADSDLCLRLGEAGYENWYVPVALYHLEGRSSALPAPPVARYDAWLLSSRWDERIQDPLSRPPVRPGGDPNPAEALELRP
jgi:hypothetical protein